MDALVVHYHELGLKGRNREFFEETLARNLRRALRASGYARVRCGFGRILVDFPSGADIALPLDRASRVFGVAYVGAGVKVAQDLDSMGRAALALMQDPP